MLVFAKKQGGVNIDTLKRKSKGKIKKRKMENPIVHKDCFAYLSSGGKEKGCAALKRLYCREENCKFYKPKANENTKECIEKIKEAGYDVRILDLNDLKSYSFNPYKSHS